MTAKKILATGAIGSLMAAIGLEYLYRERSLGDTFWHWIFFFVFFATGSLFFEGVSRFNERRMALAEGEDRTPSRFDLKVAIHAAVFIALIIMIALYTQDKLVAFALLGLLAVPVVWNWMK